MMNDGMMNVGMMNDECWSIGIMEYWNDGVVQLFQSASNQNNLFCVGVFFNNKFHVELVGGWLLEAGGRILKSIADYCSL